MSRKAQRQFREQDFFEKKKKNTCELSLLCVSVSHSHFSSHYLSHSFILSHQYTSSFSLSFPSWLSSSHTPSAEESVNETKQETGLRPLEAESWLPSATQLGPWS